MIFSEVDRAADNLMKSGKMFGGMVPGMAGRRDSMPIMGAPRPYSEYGACTQMAGVSSMAFLTYLQSGEAHSVIIPSAIMKPFARARRTICRISIRTNDFSLGRVKPSK
jgi:hypothetical protein